MFYKLAKKVAKNIPAIKTRIAYTRSLEEQLRELTMRDMEKRNLIETLHGLQEYVSDLFVEGSYRKVVTITSKVGCPVVCRYCPQDQFVNAYLKRPNPIMQMTYDTFCTILNKIPSEVLVRFTGFVENMANPDCIPMIMKALEQHHVQIYSTMFNASVEDYESFRSHPNLATFCLHLPDMFGNTKFPITDKYKSLLRHIVLNPPVHGLFWTSCLGVGGGVMEEIADIITANPNPISSYLGTVYDNYLHHGNADLECHRDSSRIQEEYAGVMAVLPNGEVLACTQDCELTAIIGNILEVESLDELLQSEERKKLRRGLTDPSLNTICRRCELAVKKSVGKS